MLQINGNLTVMFIYCIVIQSDHTQSRKTCETAGTVLYANMMLSIIVFSPYMDLENTNNSDLNL